MNKYDNLCEQIRSCQKCPLHKDMPGTKPVPGIGPIDAKIMICGEALGADEALLEEPFVGQCGTFLNNTLLVGAGLNRSDLYICNVVNCRPTKNNGKSNRPPTDYEINKCKGWLWKQIQLVQPEIIMTLGKVPTYTLLNQQLKKNFTLGSIVGQKFEVDYCKATIVPNYHPSYIQIHGKNKEDKCIDIFKQVRDLV